MYVYTTMYTQLTPIPYKIFIFHGATDVWFGNVLIFQNRGHEFIFFNVFNRCQPTGDILTGEQSIIVVRSFTGKAFVCVDYSIVRANSSLTLRYDLAI